MLNLSIYVNAVKVFLGTKFLVTEFWFRSPFTTLVVVCVVGLANLEVATYFRRVQREVSMSQVLKLSVCQSGITEGCETLGTLWCAIVRPRQRYSH